MTVTETGQALTRTPVEAARRWWPALLALALGIGIGIQVVDGPGAEAGGRCGCCPACR